MVATSRDSLDKNGSYLPFTVTTGATWAGVGAFAGIHVNSVNPAALGTWSVDMQAKMDPPQHKRYLSKLINKKGFRDSYEG